MSDVADLLAVIGAVVHVFARHGIHYFVTGSFASSMHGEFRATNDLDIVAVLDTSQLVPLLDELAGDFVVDLDQAFGAVQSGSSFNLIHRAAYLKVDVFPSTSAFDAEAIRRAESITLPGVVRSIRVATREDILLAKLRWYRLGDETSEVQRRDIQRLIALNGGELDEEYLRDWACQLDVADLLRHFLG